MLLSYPMIRGDQVHTDPQATLQRATLPLRGGLSVTRDQVTVRPRLPQRVLCFGMFINGTPSAQKSTLFCKMDQSVSISLIKPGLNSIFGLPRAACSLHRRRPMGTDSRPATCHGR